MYRVGRPIVGVLNFAPSQISSGSLARQKQLGVILHEMTHALGFSGKKLSSGFTRYDATTSSWVSVPESQIKVILAFIF